MIINGLDYSQNIPQIKCRNYRERGIDRIVVHGGRFHADDVFCVAMILMCYPNAVVVRTGSVPDEFLTDTGTIVADIGLGKYDHHQPDAEVRPDGNRYAACGLVFRDFRQILFEDDPDAADAFERNYIIPVEITDNGGEENPLSNTIHVFNPLWDSDTDTDEMFARAVAFTQSLIEREIKWHEAEKRAADKVSAALSESDGTVVILERYMPWWRVLVDSSSLFVIYPNDRKGYNLRSIYAKRGSRRPKKRLPEEWLDNMPEGCYFVHPGLFIASFDTKAAAVNAAGLAVNEKGDE